MNFDFKTINSDTEVIINSYKKWGIKCIERFVGMFAFVYTTKKIKKFI